MNTVAYCLKQGFRNFINNPLFSFVSVATVSACIFLFCMFLILAQNLKSVMTQAETNVGITVFFQDGLSEVDKQDIRSKIEEQAGVKEVRYISADDAWENFKSTYFGTDEEELIAAFEGENPLSGSDSYEVFMENIEDQPAMVSMLRNLDGVRDVNYASSAVSILKRLNTGIYGLFAIIIGILLAVSVFLISNTINVTAIFRKRENEIMKLIGAKNVMIRAPFVIEGCLIGLLGALIPLAAISFIYSRLETWISEQVIAMTGNKALQEVFQLIPPEEIRPMMLLTGLILGVGMGTLVSLLTINSHLRSMK